jgi:Holliday junction resolvase RusA-like endonuclease
MTDYPTHNSLVVEFLVDAAVQAAPRMTRSDKWNKRPCVVRYMAFRNEVALAMRAEMTNKRIPESLLTEVVRADMVFTLPMPPSWPKKKKDAHFSAIHCQRPDCDNLAKGVLDAIFGEDSRIAFLSVAKYWSTKPYVHVRLFR